MSKTNDAAQLRQALRMSLSGVLLTRFDAESRLYDALVTNRIEFEHMKVLEQMLADLKKAVR